MTVVFAINNLLLLAWSKSNQKIKAEPASLLRSLRSLSRLKLASLRQQTLRALTTVSPLNAHQLRPEIEPDGSLGIADAACSFAIPHQVREQACPRAWHGAAEEPAVSAIPRESGAFLERPKRTGVKRRVKVKRQEPALSERSEFRGRQRNLCPK